jgi:dipeptidyl aminopeptidase/acylaminoacyl peptidase
VWRKNRFGLLISILCAALVFSAVLGPLLAQGKKSLTFQDMMKFRSLSDAAISGDGRWAACTAQPDRGDGEAMVLSTTGEKTFAIKRGSEPVFSRDSAWVAAVLKPRAVEVELAKKDKPKPGLAVLDLRSGRLRLIEKVERFSFSKDSAWLAYQFCKEEEKKQDKEKDEKEEQAKPQLKDVGSTLVLVHLSSGKEAEIGHVQAFAFDESGRYFAYAVAEPDGKGNGLYCRPLNPEGQADRVIGKVERGVYTELTWEKEGTRLAYLAAAADEKGNAGPASLWTWDAGKEKSVLAVPAGSTPKDWLIPSKNKLAWSKDGKRLFFGLMPVDIFELGKAGVKDKEEKIERTEVDLFNVDEILAKREVDVWHADDPRIIPDQKKRWPKVKEKIYFAVYHTDSAKMVPLADKTVPDIEIPENANRALGFSDVPYLKEITWDGSYEDIYLVDLSSGAKKKIISRLAGKPSLSPGGRFVAYFKERNWHLYDTGTGAVRNLTAALQVPFYDEDNDTAEEPPPHGMGGWLEDGSAIFLYDKYDLWKVWTDRDEAVNLTGASGRKEDLTFRLLKLDPEERFLKKDQNLLLSAYHNHKKYAGFYAANVARAGAERLVEEEKRYTFLAKAKNADAVLFTRESYEEFPDLWTSRLDFSSRRKLTTTNPQMEEFAWGNAELVEWQSLDGTPLQGVLIKPGNYEPGRRYPVLVYFYEKFSQRLYEFNQVVVNHRPCFPFYASNGYALFLPDIVYETGRPGLSATKCLVPGVQKLIDMGIADPKAIALHGHSWSGYETAFIITQTNIFRAAIAGAPVSNMTSAYDGIRWESGLARQFQYEKTQSRIGASLWQSLPLYLENSPVFFADRIHTPLLLMFGDEDGAVPWQQGIELYLAMRRLGKDCIFLEYRGEGHHPKKYPNKLDYVIRMKEYLDHFLKGEPAPDWVSRGVPYQGQ